MTSKVSVHVGEGAASGRRFVEAWQRAQGGEGATETHLSFESWELLARTLTPKRLALLRHVHRHPATSIAALARILAFSRDRHPHRFVRREPPGFPPFRRQLARL